LIKFKKYIFLKIYIAASLNKRIGRITEIQQERILQLCERCEQKRQRRITEIQEARILQLCEHCEQLRRRITDIQLAITWRRQYWPAYAIQCAFKAYKKTKDLKRKYWPAYAIQRAFKAYKKRKHLNSLNLGASEGEDTR